MATDTPLVGSEKETLHAFLKKQRAVMLWKLQGLDDEQLRRPVVPSGTNLLGMVKHLAAVEYGWFCPTFGVETEPLPFDENDPDADLRVGADESTQDVLDFHTRAQTAVDAVIDDHDLDDTGIPWTGEPTSLRWIMVHLIEEIARHIGHADILRELIDDTTGYLPPRQ